MLTKIKSVHIEIEVKLDVDLFGLQISPGESSEVVDRG